MLAANWCISNDGSSGVLVFVTTEGSEVTWPIRYYSAIM